MTHDAVSRLSAKLNGPITLTPRKSVTAVAQAMRAPLGTLQRLEDETRKAAAEAMFRNTVELPQSPDAQFTSVSDPSAWPASMLTVPAGWLKGQLLNVRNNGAEFVVTVLGEEFDPRYPERALKFDNSWTCQQFISKWYARESHDPRAF